MVLSKLKVKYVILRGDPHLIIETILIVIKATIMASEMSQVPGRKREPYGDPRTSGDHNPS